MVLKSNTVAENLHQGGGTSYSVGEIAEAMDQNGEMTNEDLI